MTSPPAKCRVLVVDDAGEVIVLCVNMLQSLGYAVKGANRPESGLELLGKEPFDLMIVDYKMPPGDLARVQAAFGRANREQAPGGAWVHDDTGKWSRK